MVLVDRGKLISLELQPQPAHSSGDVARVDDLFRVHFSEPDTGLFA